MMMCVTGMFDVVLRLGKKLSEFLCDVCFVVGVAKISNVDP
jgi:hypothetical protein